jgi:hypothetical protein
MSLQVFVSLPDIASVRMLDPAVQAAYESYLAGEVQKATEEELGGFLSHNSSPRIH